MTGAAGASPSRRRRSATRRRDRRDTGQQRLSSRLPMHLRGIGTATPPARYTKAECLEAFERSAWFARLDARSHLIARAVLQRDNGIEARHLALDSLDEVFAIDPDTLDRRFLAHAPALATEAGAKALAAAGLDARRHRRRRRQHLHRLSVPRALRLRRRAARPARRRPGLRPGRPGLRRRLAQPAARPLAARGRTPRSTCSRSASRSAAPRCTSTTIPAC